ncbi:hypothetical protein [Ramlibacter sp.]|uniref:O-linked N-acetylglucosamine transferase family protein n=1 Tax=Ramlibacter sp. TaxID=1917967 RepID=UPI003D0BB968
MGVPVITLAGEGFSRRMSASILHNIGRPEWVAETPDQFVRIASDLASKRVKLLTAKKNLRERMQASPALDIDQYVRDLEGLYRMMWQDWCARGA